MVALEQKVTLGRTGLVVGVAGLGCGGHSRLGQSAGKSHAESVALVRRAIDLGVDFIDTAHAYGTEAIVGDGIRASGERVVVSTKAHPRRDDRPIRGDELIHFAEKSLERLGLDCIDIYNLHGVLPGEYAHVCDELVPALIRLREQGKIRFPGITEFFIGDPGHEMLQLALEDDFFDVVMVGYNLLNPSAAKRVLPKTEAAGVGTQIMFAVRRALSQPAALVEVVDGLIDDGLVEASAIGDRGDPLGFLREDADSIVEAAYRFCRHRAGAHVILSGTGNLAHLEQNLGFIQQPPLSSGSLERLEQLFGHIDSVSGN